MELAERQSNRLRAIESSFAALFFAHVPHYATNWAELADSVEKFLEGETLRVEGRFREGVVDDGERRQSLRDKLSKVMSGHPLATAFPVSPAHSRKIALWLATIVLKEEQDANVKEKEEEEPEFVFKSFERPLPDGSGSAFVTLLEENRNLIGRGTTGLTSWQGALFLADWALGQGTQYFKGKRILELGCGTGLLGVSLLKTICRCRYTFTDCHVGVLNGIIGNIKLNFPHDAGHNDEKVFSKRLAQLSAGPDQTLSEEQKRRVQYRHRLADVDGDDDCEAVVRHLDWTEFDAPQAAELGAVDLVLAADVVYERGLLPHLCRTIRTILMGNATSSTPSSALVACTERSFTTLEHFERALDAARLQHQIVRRGGYGPYDTPLTSDVQHQCIRLYQIQCDEVSV